LVNGVVYEIPVYGEEFKDIYGVQFTMGIEGLDVLEIKPGLVNISVNNYNTIKGDIVFSWNEAQPVSGTEKSPLFTIVVKSRINGELLNVLKINDNIAKSEAYSGEDLMIKDLRLEFRNYGKEYTLYQNEPNPFSESTKIGFTLPEESSYKLVVYNLSGKEVKEYNAKGKAGYNSIKISKKDIGISGVYYYRLESGSFIDTKKMVILK